VVAAKVALSDGGNAHVGIDRALETVLQTHGVDRARVDGSSTGGAPDAAPVREMIVPVPDQQGYARFNADLTRAVEDAGGTVLDALERGPDPESPTSLEVELGRGGNVTHRVRLEPEAKAQDVDEPRIAIVFDDLGYGTSGLAGELLDLDANVTFAILPGLSHSGEFAEEAHRRGHEVILHVPMEPADAHQHDPGRDALLTTLSPAENRARLRRQLESIPHFVGISNHMGSRATEDPELVDLVLGELRARDRALFFLDSRTSPYSVVTRRARQFGVTTAANNVFLDTNDEDGVVATDQTRRVAAIARRQGSAIAIGHVRPETVEAVRAALPVWREAGIRLVPLSDLMHR
jgi:hypothetical protein